MEFTNLFKILFSHKSNGLEKLFESHVVMKSGRSIAPLRSPLLRTALSSRQVTEIGSFNKDVCPAGDTSPEQMAQAVAEQISQQARQQMSEAGAEAPVPLMTALRNYLQRLDAMSQGDLSVGVFNLPPTGQAAGVRHEEWCMKRLRAVPLHKQMLLCSGVEYTNGACAVDGCHHCLIIVWFCFLSRQQCSVQPAAICSCCSRVYW